MDSPSQPIVVNASDILAARPGGSEGLSGFDRELLRAAADGKSLQEIVDDLALTVSPERIGQRIREIIRERDWLSQVEKKALLIDDLMDLRSYIRRAMSADEGLADGEPIEVDGKLIFPQRDPRWAAEMLRVLKELSRQIEVGQAGVDSAMTQIRKAHAKVMAQAVENAFDRLMFGIRKTYPDVDEVLLMRFMEDALPKAMEAIDAATAA